MSGLIADVYINDKFINRIGGMVGDVDGEIKGVAGHYERRHINIERAEINGQVLALDYAFDTQIAL